MTAKLKYIKKKHLLFWAIGTTVAVGLYGQFVLGYFSQCFAIPGELNSLGLTFGYNITLVNHFFEIRTPRQLICYGQFIQVWDNIFPIIYSSMHAFWIAFLFKKWRISFLIIFSHILSDWIENYLELIMLDKFMNSSTISETLVTFGSGITMLKWSLSLIIYTIIIWGLIGKLRVFIRPLRAS